MMDFSSEKNSRKLCDAFALSTTSNAFKVTQQNGEIYPKRNGQSFSSISTTGIKHEKQLGETGVKIENEPASNTPAKSFNTVQVQFEKIGSGIISSLSDSNSTLVASTELSEGGMISSSSDDITAIQQPKDHTGEIYVKVEDNPHSSTSTNSLQTNHTGEIYVEVEDNPHSSTSTNSLQTNHRASKKRQRKERLSFKPYISRLKKERSPSLKLSSAVLKDMDELVLDVYETCCSEFKKLLSFTRNKTLSVKEVETATKLCIPKKWKDDAVLFARDCVSCEKV